MISYVLFGLVVYLGSGVVVGLWACYWGDSHPAPSVTSAMGIPAKLVPGLYPACNSAGLYVADMPKLKYGAGALGGIYYAEGGDWRPFLA